MKSHRRVIINNIKLSMIFFSDLFILCMHNARWILFKVKSIHVLAWQMRLYQQAYGTWHMDLFNITSRWCFVFDAFINIWYGSLQPYVVMQWCPICQLNTEYWISSFSISIKINIRWSLFQVGNDLRFVLHLNTMN